MLSANLVEDVGSRVFEMEVTLRDFTTHVLVEVGRDWEGTTGT